MNIAEMISEEISKDMALEMVTRIVKFAYASDEERKEIREKVKNGR